MKLLYVEEHTSCVNYKSDHKSGFHLDYVKANENMDVEHRDKGLSYMLFILEGEMIINNSGYAERCISAGEFIFLAQSHEIDGYAVTDGRILLLAMEGNVRSLCDKYTLESYAKLCPDIKYRFEPLSIKHPLDLFIKLLTTYLENGVNCTHLHELKQKELFILMRTIYTRDELTALFYPIIGHEMSFREKVLQQYKNVQTIRELAEYIGISLSPFMRKFKKEFGMPPYKWILQQRANQIRHRLLSNETTINDIIIEFNFNSPAHFNTFCREQFGCTPTELIAEIRSKTGDKER